MNFKMSMNVAIWTDRKEEAVEFYSKVLGFPQREHLSQFATIDAEPFTFFIGEDEEFKGPVMELFVPDLDAAREHLVANGCKILRWRGKGQDCYVEDPFGLIFNVWEE
jgi:catechol 2,3-dioxygenase-like lactoylglutathione lyase family enzyme